MRDTLRAGGCKAVAEALYRISIKLANKTLLNKKTWQSKTWQTKNVAISEKMVYNRIRGRRRGESIRRWTE